MVDTPQIPAQPILPGRALRISLPSVPLYAGTLFSAPAAVLGSAADRQDDAAAARRRAPPCGIRNDVLQLVLLAATATPPPHPRGTPEPAGWIHGAVLIAASPPCPSLSVTSTADRCRLASRRVVACRAAVRRSWPAVFCPCRRPRRCCKAGSPAPVIRGRRSVFSLRRQQSRQPRCLAGVSAGCSNRSPRCRCRAVVDGRLRRARGHGPRCAVAARRSAPRYADSPPRSP